MTTLQKVIVTATIAVLAGADIYEARQASQLRDQVQTLQQQQEPLAEQVQQLQNERDAATNRAAMLHGENERLNRNAADLLKMRGEVTRLRNGLAAVAQLKTDSESKDNSLGATNTYITTIPLSQRIHQIEMYLLNHPEAGIPEVQFASPVKWLNSIQGPIGSDEQLSNALMLLRRQAMSGFMSEIRMAELEFEKANDGRFPDTLARLLPFLDSTKGQVMLDNYEIVPAKTITDPNAHITGDWVIVRKMRVNPNSNSSMERLAAYAGGQSAWYNSDSRD
jgi:outer membrane murein-binding lipoprotein Lpp